MGDISREPLPGGARSKGPSGKGPAEVIRLDELTVEERMEASDPPERCEPDDDPAARAFPSPRFAPAAPMRIEPFAVPEARELRILEAAGEAEDPVAADEAVPAEESVSAGETAEHAPAAEPGDEQAPEESVESSLPADEDLQQDELAAEIEASIVVPEIDDLVAEDDPDAAPSSAEPMLQALPDLSALLISDDAPPLTEATEVARVLLAVLLCSREPLTFVRLAEVCNSTQKAVQAGIAQLDRELRERGMPLELLQVGDGIRVATSPVVYPYLTRLKKLKAPEKLSPAALETLAVIAYRQPVIRAEIEAIRGVKVGPMLRSLLDHKLVKVVGRSEVPGRPLQYGTTQVFLDRFALRSLKDLPSVQEFRSLG